MVRLGFFLGFLIGGGIASLLARKEDDDAAGLLPDRAGVSAPAGHPVVDRIKHQFSDAQDAAREAQLEKEAEMRRLYDDMVHRKPGSSA